MSKDLRKRGLRFVGPTICYAFMQAVGVVNDHTTKCFRYDTPGSESIPGRPPSITTKSQAASSRKPSKELEKESLQTLSATPQDRVLDRASE